MGAIEVSYEPEVQPPQEQTLSLKERKKLEKAEKKLKKEKAKWKMYIDFLLRHIAITTSKYVHWEKNEFETFKGALEKAQRLDDKDQTDAKNLKKLKARCDILEKKKYFNESDMLKKYLDMVARMRGLNLVGKSFIKVAKKSKLEPRDPLERQSAVWKCFVSPGIDVTAMTPQDVDSDHPGLVGVCLVIGYINIPTYKLL